MTVRAMTATEVVQRFPFFVHPGVHPQLFDPAGVTGRRPGAAGNTLPDKAHALTSTIHAQSQLSSFHSNLQASCCAWWASQKNEKRKTNITPAAHEADTQIGMSRI